MSLQKNVAGQKLRVFAFNRTTNAPHTGGAASITCKVSKDWGTRTALTDTNPTETEDGFYLFDLSADETNGSVLDFYPESSTSNIQVVAVPATIYTKPAIAAISVSHDRTWYADDGRARNIVTVHQNFAGTLAVMPDLNPQAVINAVTSVAISGAASVTTLSEAVSADGKAAHFTVPALSTVGTYSVLVTVTTNDSQTIPTTCTLKVV